MTWSTLKGKVGDELLRGRSFPYAQAWRYLLTLVSPTLNSMVQVGREFRTLAVDGYDSVVERPTADKIKPYDFGIAELTASIERIANSRADGSTVATGRATGLTPGELSRSDHPQDGALLYWLLYGSGTPRQQRDLIEQISAIPSERNADVRAEETEGIVERWLASLSRPSWATLRPSQSEITNNLLDPRGMDPRTLARTYVTYSFVIEIEDVSGTKLQLDLRPQRANAVDAALLAVDMEGQIERLGQAVANMEARLESMATFGYNWMLQANNEISAGG